MSAGTRIACSCVFFNDTATPEIYTLSLHDALPISKILVLRRSGRCLTVTLSNDAVHVPTRSEEHTSELQSHEHLVCRPLLEKKKRGARQAGFASAGTALVLDVQPRTQR